jgi:hypothetical protein
MDIDEIVAGLSGPDREALLARLQEGGPEADDDLGKRVSRLEDYLERRGSKHRSSGPRGGYGRDWASGGPPCHAHHHCPQCGW